MDMDAAALRNFKDFLQLYNKMSEICFTRCIDNINSRKLDSNEIVCVEDCSAKFVKFNNKLMQNFVKAQSEIVSKRVEESEKQKQLQNTQPEQNPLLQSHSIADSQDNGIVNKLQNSEPEQSQSQIVAK